MAKLQSLAKDTAIYGLSSIVGRFLNYLLVPLYTRVLPPEEGGYGVVTNVYAYVALLLVMLTFGMETSFFRFINKSEENPNRVYSTTLILVGSVCLLFMLLTCAFYQPISSWMGYPDHPEYIVMMLICVAIDAFQCMPFAYLRYQKKALKFASLKFLNIIMLMALNMVILYFLPHFGILEANVVYIFAINLFCSALLTLFLFKELVAVRYVFDKSLAKRMLSYAWPILILGIAGILNQTADKILYPMLKPGHQGAVELGVYGACVKIAMIMAMITQAFRYAYEPFVFGSSKEKNNDTYAAAMKYFIIFTLLAFLGVMGYLDILKYLLRNHGYWDGLSVVPIVMAAEIMMGIYFNLSFWYKLIDKTIWGAWFSGAGCLVLIFVNILFVPRFGYMACAWGGVAGYATAMLLSYFVGQKYYPIKYPLGSIAVYVIIAAFFTAIMLIVPKEWPLLLRLSINTVLILAFVGHIIYHDLPLGSLPVIGKYFRK